MIDWFKEKSYIIVPALVVIIIVAVLIIKYNNYERGYSDCQSIDGEYIVVDQQWNGKNRVDVYGCVKKDSLK